MADNVGTVTAVYEAFGRGDAAWIIDQLDDNVMWDGGVRDSGLAYLRAGQGKEHVAEFFGHLASTLEFTHFEPLAMCDGGDVVSVPVRHAGRIIGGGEIAMTDEVHVWRFNNEGKVVEFNHFLDIAIHERAAAARSKQYEGRTLRVVGETLEVLQAGESFEVFELTGTLDAGPPPHAHAWIESYYGLVGETAVDVDGVVTLLGHGDFVSIPAGVVHSYRTLTSDARFLVMTGGHRASAFFADVDANVPPGEPNPATLPLLVDVAKRNGLTSPLFS